MVRPERFELPTLWFEAKCSIQLSYGRVMRSSKITDLAGCGQLNQVLLLCCGGLRFGERGREHRHGFYDVEAGAAQELVDDGLGEAGGVVLDADGLFGFAEIDASDSVDFADFGDGKGCSLCGRRSVAVQDIKLGHASMIAAARGT